MKGEIKVSEITGDLIQQLIRLEVERAVSTKYEKGVKAEVAAEYLGVSVDTLMAEVKAHRVPHVRLRGRYVFHIPTLDRWMQEQGLKNAQGVIPSSTVKGA